MHKPATLIDAVEVVRKSRLVPEERLCTYLDQLRSEWPLDPPADELFDDMVTHGLLTKFQATLLGNGRWLGFEVGNYRILDRLGQGGNGQVFLAEHTLLGQRVALKVLSRHSASPLAMERFLREARAAAKLRHPNIIRVHDVNPSHDPPYIVMEYADGLTLQAAVARYGTFVSGDAASIGRQVALGLHEAFCHGLVHRDVKPANVLVDRRGVARLLDLGIVLIDGENLSREYPKNIILGTLDYLSPEQALDSSKVDTRADIFSLGATLYFLLAGAPPFAEGSVKERLAKLQHGELPSLGILRPDVPAGLCEAIHRMLAKRPEDRFETPLEAAVTLEAFAQESTDFPARLFRHLHATLSDADGRPTPSGGYHRAGLEAAGTPTDRHAVEMITPADDNDVRSLLPTASSRSPRYTMLAIAALLFGLLAIAFYICS